VTDTESDLLNALLALERAAGASPNSEPRPSIPEVLAEIDRLTESLPPGTPAELRHFLQRKSYQKAALFLMGRNKENQRGRCDE
jgi:hypothetical protein